MNALYKQITLLVLLSTFFSSINATILVDFKELDLNQISNQGKKILISFSAEWCAPCQVINESIFNDQEIAALINENFIPIKADIYSETGIIWNDLYNANKLPTTLFAEENGKEIERLNGVPNRNDFLNLLHKILASEVVVPKASFAKNMEAKASVSRSVISTPHSEINYTTSKNFSIQVGAFKTTENALKLIDALNQKGVYNASLMEETTNGMLYQKVVLRDFKNEDAARIELNNLKKKGIDGFIKKV